MPMPWPVRSPNLPRSPMQLFLRPILPCRFLLDLLCSLYTAMPNLWADGLDVKAGVEDQRRFFLHSGTQRSKEAACTVRVAGVKTAKGPSSVTTVALRCRCT